MNSKRIRLILSLALALLVSSCGSGPNSPYVPKATDSQQLVPVAEGWAMVSEKRNTVAVLASRHINGHLGVSISIDNTSGADIEFAPACISAVNRSGEALKSVNRSELEGAARSLVGGERASLELRKLEAQQADDVYREALVNMEIEELDHLISQFMGTASATEFKTQNIAANSNLTGVAWFATGDDTRGLTVSVELGEELHEFHFDHRQFIRLPGL